MRRLCAISTLIVAAACARTPPPAKQDVNARERLAVADALVTAGCYDCLVTAYRQYDVLRRTAAVGRMAEAGTIRASALAALRERELGMPDGGYLAAARQAAAEAPDTPASIATVLELVDLLPDSSRGTPHPPGNDDDLRRALALTVRRDEFAAALRDLASRDLLGAYALASFTCGASDMRGLDPEVIGDTVTPLLQFRRATCRSLDASRLETLLQQDPRFLEVHYLLGRDAIGRRDLDGAQLHFEQAYAWRPKWPALTRALANVALTAEEFEIAARYYDETIELDPLAADARLGKVRALTYLGRHGDAVAVTNELLASQWYVADARYWRALNEAQMQQYDAAWVDIEEAERLLVNAEVPKLAGIVAFRRHDLDTSRQRFETSHQRNAGDCETGFYLGLVLADLRQWPATAETLVASVACLDAAEGRLLGEIAEIRASSDPPARQARQIARRERDIASGRRMRATSVFNIAVASFSLGRAADARRYAEMVANDAQFGERARELLSRLK
jgi:tetratricopeptide (TPR) repeat protein